MEYARGGLTSCKKNWSSVPKAEKRADSNESQSRARADAKFKKNRPQPDPQQTHRQLLGFALVLGCVWLVL